LLSLDLHEKAYNRYALDANQGTTHLATFRGLVKKYPHIPAADILNDLVASQPGSEGKSDIPHPCYPELAYKRI